jgi:hypothetical protein
MKFCVSSTTSSLKITPEAVGVGGDIYDFGIIEDDNSLFRH